MKRIVELENVYVVYPENYNDSISEDDEEEILEETLNNEDDLQK